MTDIVATEAFTAPGAVSVGGELYRRDGKGNLVPEGLVKAQDKLEDETVRKIVKFAGELSAQIARFKQHTLDDVASLLALFAQDYGDKRGGQKGNVTLTSFDGLLRVQLQVADRFAFGPQLQIAKNLVDECLNEWSEGSRDEIRTIIQRAFDVDKEGQINRANLLALKRLDITDERWQRAMQAINDATRVVGTKEYVRVYSRPDARAAWQPVSIDMAAV